MAHLPKGQGVFLPPFKAWLASNIPAVYDNTMTYYEELCALIKYLQDVVIPALNHNAEAVTTIATAVEQLQKYVEDYFKNLDVQEEINNKLDEMAEDGTLQEIIAAYLEANVTWTFNTVADMKSATNLVEGSYAKTLGYHSINDGGEATYYIIEHVGETIDEGQYVEISNTLTASLVFEKSVSVKQFGAKGDGVTDDTTAFKNAFVALRNSNAKTLYVPKGTYIVTDTLLPYGIDGLSIVGENDDIYTSSIIMRGADKTIFNFGGVMELSGITYHARDLLLKNITFRDAETTYTNYPFATIHYTQHFTFENCSITNNNKSLDIRHCYDSRFINTDFSAGGNSSASMITLHGGKHASPTEIGWDSANCISFIGCRFERYFGSAIETTTETQPDTYNTDYDPAVSVNCNNIYFSTCRFEAPTLQAGNHLKFVNTNNIRIDASMTVLDGQPNLQPIYISGCSGVMGTLSVGYNRSTVVDGTTFVSFEQPIIKLLNGSNKVSLTLAVLNVYTNYALDYFVDITATDATRRTINIDLIYNGISKKMYNQASGNQGLNIYKQGREIRYGRYENGFGLKMNNDDNNTYFNNMTYDTTNQRYQLENRYTNSSNTNRTNDIYISNDNFTYHKNNCGILFDGSLVITPGKYPSTEISSYRSTGSTGRSIMYGTTYPTSEISGTTFRAGDIIFNQAPSAGGSVGWVCVTSGNPGTWKAFGSIES